MADVKRLPRPEPSPPISNPMAGKIKVFVSGKLNITSDDQRVVIERKQ